MRFSVAYCYCDMVNTWVSVVVPRASVLHAMSFRFIHMRMFVYRGFPSILAYKGNINYRYDQNNFEKAEYAGGEGESFFLIFVLYCANKFVSLQAG